MSIEETINSIIQELKRIKTQTNLNKNDNWGCKAKYLEIKEMSNDDTGEIGEMLLNSVFKKYDYNVIYEKAKTRIEKDWDIEINNYKIEVKTATIGKNANTFQHEKLYKKKEYDILILIDITSDKIYCAMGYKRNINWENLHQRTINTTKTDEHKLDLSLTSYKNNIAGTKGKEKILPVHMKEIKEEKDLVDLFEELIKQ